MKPISLPTLMLPFTPLSDIAARVLSIRLVRLTLTSFCAAPVTDALALPIVCPASSVTLTLPGLLIMFSKVKTMVWPLPMARGSTVTAPPTGIFPSIVKPKLPATPCVLRDWTLTSEPASADGVTELDAIEAGPVPALLVAVTVKLYAVPLLSPVTTTGDADAEADALPGLATTV